MFSCPFSTSLACIYAEPAPIVIVVFGARGQRQVYSRPHREPVSFAFAIGDVCVASGACGTSLCGAACAGYDPHAPWVHHAVLPCGTSCSLWHVLFLLLQQYVEWTRTTWYRNQNIMFPTDHAGLANWTPCRTTSDHLVPVIGLSWFKHQTIIDYQNTIMT
jgi:hypothetical protein